MGLLATFQKECADRLLADPFFQYIAVLTEQTNDIESEFERALSATLVTGGKTGACVIIMTAEANAEFENVPGPLLDDVMITAQVLENVSVNRDPNGNGTGKLASDIAETVAALLHQFFPTSCNGPLVIRKPTIKLLPHPDYLAYSVNFQAKGEITYAMPQAAVPSIINNAGSISFICDTPGAAVFYTLDGSNPSPRSGTLALAPFTPGSNITIKARAWLAGYLGSETAILLTT
jgi:hypothetical protein